MLTYWQVTATTMGFETLPHNNQLALMNHLANVGKKINSQRRCQFLPLMSSLNFKCHLCNLDDIYIPLMPSSYLGYCLCTLNMDLDKDFVPGKSSVHLACHLSIRPLSLNLCFSHGHRRRRAVSFRLRLTPGRIMDP